MLNLYKILKNNKIIIINNYSFTHIYPAQTLLKISTAPHCNVSCSLLSLPLPIPKFPSNLRTLRLAGPDFGHRSLLTPPPPTRKGPISTSSFLNGWHRCTRFWGFQWELRARRSSLLIGDWRGLGIQTSPLWIGRTSQRTSS